jgi:hypothetical protein
MKKFESKTKKLMKWRPAIAFSVQYKTANLK